MSTAGSLCYATALAIVPALALIFGALAGFPAFARLRGDLEHFLLANLVPNTGARVEGAIGSFVAAAGKLTTFGVIGLAVTAILLLFTIESAFNRIFRVTHPRPLFLRLVILWTVLTLGPFVSGIGLTLFGYFSAFDTGTDFLSRLSALLFGHVMPTIMTWVVVTYLYFAIPNRRVRWRDATIGAALTAVLFAVLREGFGFYIKSMTSYSAIYGTLAAVPVFLLWLYLIWIVMLAGAVIAAAIPDWRLRDAGLATGPGLKLAVALEALICLRNAFGEGSPLRLERLAKTIGVPEAATLPVLEELRRVRYVSVTEGGLWVLCRDLARVRLADLVYRFGFGIGGVAEELRASQLGARVCKFLDAAVRSEHKLLDVSLAEVIDGEARETSTADQTFLIQADDPRYRNV